MAAAPSSVSRRLLVSGADAAAGAEWTEAVPAGKWWELLSVSVALAQGITQTPQPMLVIDNGATAVNAVQTITLDATPAGGALVLHYNAPPDYAAGGSASADSASIDGTTNITAAEVQTALRTITGLSLVTVTGSDGGPYTVTFVGGAVGGRPVPLLTVATNTITPATNVAIVTATPGVMAGVYHEAFGSSAAQAVSTTCRYTWAPDLVLSGQVGATTNVHSTAPLPGGPRYLPPGTRIRTNTIGIGANSDYAAPSLYVVEYAA